MIFDKGVRVYEQRKFEYVEDPRVEMVESGVYSIIRLDFSPNLNVFKVFNPKNGFNSCSFNREHWITKSAKGYSIWGHKRDCYWS
jgi:hypothetical protein